MTALAQTLEKIPSLTEEGYKYGFFTDIQSEQAPLGLNEDTVRFISAGAPVAPRMAAAGILSMAEDGAARLGETPHRAHRLSGRL